MRGIGRRLNLGIACCLAGALWAVPAWLQAQAVNRCGITSATEKLYTEHPEWMDQIKQAEQDLEQETLQKTQGGSSQQNACSDVKVVPVVFHIIHQNGPENISDQTVFDAVEQLNLDFRLWNEDSAEIIQAFKPSVGEALIEFRLAQLDPAGNPTNGIDRIQSAETNVGDDGSKLNAWPRSKYLNIWVVKANPEGAAAYAYLPSSVASGGAAYKDGIITKYTYVGKGERTLTHETGHWINLSHTWGPGNNAGDAGNCSIDDGVNDTPNCIGTPGGCDLTRTTCSSLDMVQNYMDYASCEIMFTAGQVSRMRSALGSIIAQRNQLSTASNLMATGVYEGDVTFSSNLTSVCAGSQVEFKDESYNGICQWTWSFPGGTPGTSDKRLPVVVYDYPGSYNVTLTVSNDTGSASVTMTDYIEVTASRSLPFQETFTGGSDWSVSGQGGPAWGYTGFTFSGSSGCMGIYNYGQGSAGEVDEMISPGIDLSVLTTGQVTFRVAYAQMDASTNDILRVYTSGDCGGTWATSWLSGGAPLAGTNGAVASNFVPNDTNDWKAVTVNLSPAMLTENFRIKFELTSDEGNNIFIDNINVQGTYGAIPLLVSPPNYAEDLPFTVLLDWKAVAGVDFYDYRIDTVASMDSPYLITGSNAYIGSGDNGQDTEYVLSGLDNAMTVFWSVRTRSGTDSSAWSSVWRFMTIPSVTPPPVLVSPPDYSENQPISVLLNWNAVSGVDFYDYRIDTASSMDSPYLITGSNAYIGSGDNGPDTEYLLSGLDSAMTVFWSVRVRSGTDSSSWSPVWRFATIPDIPDGILAVKGNILALSVFPNPSGGEVIVGFDLNGSADEIRLEIIDVLGRGAQQNNDTFNGLAAGHHEVRINNLAEPGMYFVRLWVDGASIYTRFTIIK